MHIGTIISFLGCIAVPVALDAADAPPTAKPPATRPAAPATKPAVPEAAVKATVERAVRYLRNTQHDQGGWGHVEIVNPGLSRLQGLDVPQLAGDPMRRRFYSTPSLSGTGPAVLALLEAGQSLTEGSAAARLRAGLEFVHEGLTVGEQHARRPMVPGEGILLTPGRGVQGLVQNPGGGTSVVLPTQSARLMNDDAACAVAVEAMLAARRGAADTMARLRIEAAAMAGVDRLRRDHQGNGTWPEGVEEAANLAAAHVTGFAVASVGGLGKTTVMMNANPTPPPPPSSHPVLGDALILRTLSIAAREGISVDGPTVAAARAQMARLYDPRTGRLGGGGPQAYYQAVAVLNMLYQADVDARRLAAAAGPAANNSPDPAAAAGAAAARAALEGAQAAFFKELRDANQPRPAAAANAAGKNPLDQNPLDPPKAADAGKDGAGGGDVRIRVPVTSADLIAYFLLLESLRDSTHPDARPVRDGIVQAIVRRQHAGGWFVSDGDHFATAWATRVLLLPPPAAVK